MNPLQHPAHLVYLNVKFQVHTHTVLRVRHQHGTANTKTGKLRTEEGAKTRQAQH
jgi:hypothetical protein